MKHLKPFNVKIAMIIILLIALLPISTVTGYYYFLRYAIFAGIIFLAIKEKNINYPKHYVAFFILGLIWFPFSYLYIQGDKFLWVILDVIGIFIIYKILMSTSEKTNLLLSLKKIIDNAIIKQSNHSNENERDNFINGKSETLSYCSDSEVDYSYYIKQIGIGLLGTLNSICTFFLLGMVLLLFNSIPQIYNIIFIIIDVILSIIVGKKLIKRKGNSRTSIYTYIISLILCVLYVLNL